MHAHALYEVLCNLPNGELEAGSWKLRTLCLRGQHTTTHPRRNDRVCSLFLAVSLPPPTWRFESLALAAVCASQPRSARLLWDLCRCCFQYGGCRTRALCERGRGRWEIPSSGVALMLAGENDGMNVRVLAGQLVVMGRRARWGQCDRRCGGGNRRCHCTLPYSISR